VHKRKKKEGRNLPKERRKDKRENEEAAFNDIYTYTYRVQTDCV